MPALLLQSIRRHPLSKALGLLVGYLISLWIIRLIVMTITAFIVFRSHESLQKIEDFLSANQVLTYGVGALLFAIALQFLHPLTRTKFANIFDFRALRVCFAPNFLGGVMLAVVYLIGGLISGQIKWLGVYLHFDEVAMSMATALVFSVNFFIFVSVEEFIIRRAIEPELRLRFDSRMTLAIASALFLGIYLFQFDITVTECLNLVLFSLSLSRIARLEKTHMASAVFFGTYLILIHTIFGLPFFDQEMPGIFLLRTTHDDTLARLLSGGVRGPENGIVLTVLLVIYFYIPQIRSKNSI